MKRKIFQILVIMFVISSLIVAIVKISKEDKTEIIEVASNTSFVTYPVFEGKIVNTYTVKGEVISGEPESYTESIVIDYVNNSNFTLEKAKGSDIEEGEILYYYYSTPKKVNFNGKVVNVEQEGKQVIITLLNYDKLFINTKIEESKKDIITYETPVKISIDGVEFEANINQIGYEISDNKINIEIVTGEKLVPGKKVDVSFQTGIKELGLYIPKAALIQDGDKYYANLKTENGLGNTIEVQTGEIFIGQENDIEVEYIEIISGLKIGDMVIKEVLNKSSNNNVMEDFGGEQ